MSEDDKQKRKQYMKECRKNQYNNALKNVKEKNGLKSVDAEVVSNFIKHDLESFADAEVYNNYDEYDFKGDSFTGSKYNVWGQ